jgi:cytochrome c peroxidase
MRLPKLTILAVFVFFAAVLLIWPTDSLRVSGKSFGSALAAPTGFSATDRAYANKVGMRWDAIRGATVYRIFRNTVNDLGSAVEVGSTPANYFFDVTAVPEQVYFYWIRSENASDISTFSTPDQGTRAAGSPPQGPLAPLEPPLAPIGNAVTAAKAYLGKTLFWDEQLSSTKTVSCGTCHRPAHGGSDPRTQIGSGRSRNPGFDGAFGTGDDIFGSPGVPKNYQDGSYDWDLVYGMNEQVMSRKSPSYLNAAYTNNGLFWDGRASEIFRDPFTQEAILDSRGALESQTIFPPVSAAEMGHQNRDWNQVAARVAASRPLVLASDVPDALATWIGGRSYPELFQEAFGTPDVTPVRIALAIATHERTLFSDQTPLDRAAVGLETLTDAEERGKDFFVQLCSSCHTGPLLSDRAFHNIGVRPQIEDIGRNIVTGGLNDLGAFKTPTLRNLELRAPYMHNGRFASIEDVVAFYNRGGDFDAPNIDHLRIHPLNLPPGAQADLAAFLRRPLTDDRVRNELPPFDRPQLYTESGRVPVISGTGRAGNGSIVPNVIAIEPPLVGNQSFTVAVNNALAGAQATVVIDSADPGIGNIIPATGSFAVRQTTLQSSTGSSGYGSIVLQIPNDPSLVGRTFYGRWYVVDPAADSGFAVSRLFSFTVFGAASVAKRSPFDFDGDSKTDISIFRSSVGEWWYSRSSDGQVRAGQFGNAADVLTPGDFTGDGKADIAFWRPSDGFWYILRSEDSSFFSFPFGANGDIPMPSDFDGDGKTDAAVFRPSEGLWYILQSSGAGTAIIPFGSAGDKPVSADYDGDGKADIGIVRDNLTSGNKEWWIQRSNLGLMIINFGVPGDRTVPGDYTGDGKADVAFFRPGSGFWFILRSEDFSFFSFRWGQSGDIPTPGDYDGDGKFDAAVFRPATSTWFVNRTAGRGPLITDFGLPADTPVPSCLVR